MTKSVTITENGTRKKISKLDAAATQLANDAARGDKESIQLIIALLQAFEPTVGYSQPPLEHRFRKGVSGNPKGRGKGTKNFVTTFMTAIEAQRPKEVFIYSGVLAELDRRA